MGPSELQELVDFEPFGPLRLTLSSGNVIDLRQREGVNITGLTMTIADTTIAGTPRVRLVSLPTSRWSSPSSQDLRADGWRRTAHERGRP